MPLAFDYALSIVRTGRAHASVRACGPRSYFQDQQDEKGGDSVTQGLRRLAESAIELANVMETKAKSAKTNRITTTTVSLWTTRVVASNVPNLTSFFSVS